MSYFLGQIRMFAGDFAPAGWAICNGQIMPVPEFEELFYILGNTFGGDGINTFALPDLRGRAPIHASEAYALGAAGGSPYVSLTEQELPPHKHDLFATPTIANSAGPENAAPAQTNTFDAYQSTPPQAVTMAPQTVGPAGMSMGHENRQPYIALTYIICLFGIIPTP